MVSSVVRGRSVFDYLPLWCGLKSAILSVFVFCGDHTCWVWASNHWYCHWPLFRFHKITVQDIVCIRLVSVCFNDLKRKCLQLCVRFLANPRRDLIRSLSLRSRRIFLSHKKLNLLVHLRYSASGDLEVFQRVSVCLRTPKTSEKWWDIRRCWHYDISTF